ncbi:MAG: aminotransferase class V-fold PLP-dependent enzyme [Spirochaetales bacterium]|nr:aminotransferase class V-fold PLP-dependent enzyme [Spirochaetales bacterium]
MIKDDFPYFRNNNIVYLDSASTTQKPQIVLDSIMEYYTHYCSNTHRGSYNHGDKTTTKFEESRNYIKEFIGGRPKDTLIFTKGVTEGINLVANSYVKNNFKSVIISSLEHHSNITPWHMQGRTLGNGLEVIGYNKDLTIDLNHLEDLLKKNRDSFLSITHISNAFGILHPIKEIIDLSRKYNAKILIDGAQAANKLKLDMSWLQPDFYTFSAHKCYGPTGVGALYVNSSIINDLTPYQTGGAVIDRVSYKQSTYLPAPLKFEAGTQNIAGVIGFKKGVEYIKSVGFNNIKENEKKLIKIIYSEFNKIDGVTVWGDTHNMGNISFNVDGITPIDLGILLDKQKIAVRAGHHCAMPIMESLGIDGTLRISLGVYSNESDIQLFFSGLIKAIKILRG